MSVSDKINTNSRWSIYGIFCVLLIANSSANAECSITFGGDGKSRTETTNTSKEINHMGGGWSFIRKTSGPCSFRVYNQEQLNGRYAVYGSEITQRTRIGSKGAQNKNGWRGRSVHIVKHQTMCSITIGDAGIRQTFYGPGEIDKITGWNFVNNTMGNCTFEVHNKFKLKGKSNKFHEGVSERRRVGYRIRSIKIQSK